MTIIEAVARGICRALIDDADTMLPVDEKRQAYVDLRWREWIPAAKAAILATLKAIEEPSEYVLGIGDVAAKHCKHDDPMLASWQAMLSALTKQLEEQSK